MAARETLELAEIRWRDLELLQGHYAEFNDFLVDVIEDFMKFQCTEIQEDIGNWIAYGPQYRMVQAQRGQAKTTITAAYAVWRCIQDPTTRVLIISSGSTMAVEIANWVIQIINGMPELECLRPDRAAGDRCSTEAFDIHHSLKGPEKSPSVACVGITSNLQGKRADLLIADDIESSKNSQTQTQRERLHHLTLDFTSICSNGDIVWLGTPQSIDSIYNSLPTRGTHIRIWPGRYPTVKEEEEYDGFLAPLIASRVHADPSLRTGGGPTGERGKPVDPVLLGEDALTKKEIDQGPSYFQLQHMLSTKLADADRFPLKLGSIRFTGFDTEAKLGPMTIGFMRNAEAELTKPDGFHIKDKMYASTVVENMGLITGWHMYVDPAGGGQNGDETGYAVTGFLAGRIFVAAVGGVPGGVTEHSLAALTRIAKQWKPTSITIEENFGAGALRQVWTPLLLAEMKKELNWTCSIEEEWVSDQKELRIIDTIEPLLAAGKLVMQPSLLQEDWLQIQKYPLDQRKFYSLFFQMARITRDKKSLAHEDRLDALAGACRRWIAAVAQDDNIVIARQKQEAYNKMMQDPLGNGRPMPGFATRTSYTVKGTRPIGRLGR